MDKEGDGNTQPHKHVEVNSGHALQNEHRYAALGVGYLSAGDGAIALLTFGLDAYIAEAHPPGGHESLGECVRAHLRLRSQARAGAHTGADGDEDVRANGDATVAHVDAVLVHRRVDGRPVLDHRIVPDRDEIPRCTQLPIDTDIGANGCPETAPECVLDWVGEDRQCPAQHSTHVRERIEQTVPCAPPRPAVKRALDVLADDKPLQHNENGQCAEEPDGEHPGGVDGEFEERSQPDGKNAPPCVDCLVFDEKNGDKSRGEYNKAQQHPYESNSGLQNPRGHEGDFHLVFQELCPQSHLLYSSAAIGVKRPRGRLGAVEGTIQISH
mmetsp:Transcript_5942/g.14390  ORF Transcript_5942/g.14390 Transcript_5942/m.14390 type:complete len:326 (+) Transcript_5942:231-1208(+)